MLSLEIINKIELQIFSPGFYRHDFRDLKCAADFLRVSVSELVSVLYDEYGTTLQDFLISMRMEDVREHLDGINPREPLRRLAALYGFRSGLHLLWRFYRQEKCTPRRWARKMGCLIPRDLNVVEIKQEGGV